MMLIATKQLMKALSHAQPSCTQILHIVSMNTCGINGIAHIKQSTYSNANNIKTI